MSDREDTSGDAITDPVEVAELRPDEARLLAGRLRADGIPATVYPDDISTATRSFGLAGLVSVLVPKEQAEEAAELVKAIQSQPPDDAELEEDPDGEP